MSTSQARKLYNLLLDNGDLKNLYSSMKGSWDKDKRCFTNQYEENEELIRLTNQDCK